MNVDCVVIYTLLYRCFVVLTGKHLTDSLPVTCCRPVVESTVKTQSSFHHFAVLLCSVENYKKIGIKT